MPNPWMTSDDLLSCVKRKISFPTSQNTFTDEDVLAFANEELMLAQVPSMLQYHEEFFATSETVTLVAGVSRYPIPTRAIGMKLRGVFYQDSQGNLGEMTRVDSDAKAYFQNNVGSDTTFHKYYLEGNDVVLTDQVGDAVTGNLVLYYFLRPNMLTTTDQAATIESFSKAVTLSNADIVAGDTITVDGVAFTAVASGAGANEFDIAGSSILTATNLVNSINNDGTVGTAANGGGSTAVVTVTYSDRQAVVETSNDVGFVISASLILNVDQVPTSFVANELVDFLQTKPGHKTRALSITLNGIAALTLSFTDTDVPTDLLVGDYLCLENQCIIPQIPPDLHNGLAERTAARILAALGDLQGLQASNAKLAEIESRQGMLLDNRTEGEPRKVLARKSLLRFGKMRPNRRRL